MTITTVAQWDGTTAANNVDLNGIPLDSSVMTPSQVDDALREMMKQVKAGIGVSFQAYSASVTGVGTAWTTASSSGPASLAFAEDTDNGTNKITVTAPAAIASDISLTLPATAGTLVGTAGSQTLTDKTLTDPIITGAILEDIYTITDGAAFEVDPGNGSIQIITLTASRTPKATNFANGESVTLHIVDGTAYSITWTDATWGGSGVVWVGGTAPTLATTGYTVVELWKFGNQTYGTHVGDVA